MSGCSGCMWRSGLGLKPKSHVSFSCAVSPWGCPCGFLRQRTRPGGWFDAMCHGLQRVSSTGDGQCRRHQEPFWECLCTASSEPLCCDGQRRVRHTERSWASDGLPSWRRVLPSVAVTSAAWLQNWSVSPVREPRRWWRIHSSECWGWYGDSADGNARGAEAGSGR